MTLEHSRRGLAAGAQWERALGLTLLAIFLALYPGCHKKRAPSEQFGEAHLQFTRLYAAKLDDAYRDPQIAGIEQLLLQVREDSLDFAAAQELLRRIRDGRVALEAADKARSEAQAKVMASGSYQRMTDNRAAAPASAPVDDAGAAHPMAGMALGEFTRRFSNCFRSTDAVDVIGRGKMDSWELKDIANCRDRHPGFDAQFVLTDARQVSMVIPKAAVEYRMADGGMQPKESPRPR